MKKILVAMFPKDMETIEKKLCSMDFPDAEFLFAYSPEEVEKYIPHAHIIFAIPFLVSNYINKAEKLEWFQSGFSGIDALMGAEKKNNYLLTNVKDIFSQIMAEYVLAYILMFSKNIVGNLDAQTRKYWDKKPYPSISVSKVGIIGTGSIGACIAKNCKKMGMKTFGLSRTGKQSPDFEQVYTWDEQATFFADLDYVVSVLPSTPETENIIGTEVFQLMKQEAVFINVGRGSNVSEADIIAALESKKIAAAVLDVFKTEPL